MPSGVSSEAEVAVSTKAELVFPTMLSSLLSEEAGFSLAGEAFVQQHSFDIILFGCMVAVVVKDIFR